MNRKHVEHTFDRPFSLSAMSHEPFTAAIIDIALPDSYGVAKKDGLVVFIPDCVPGDQVMTRIVRKGKSAAYGELLDIESPSPFRVAPSCPHFSICGGCTLQNLSYEKQLQIKENHVRETLKRIGKIDIDNSGFSSIMPSPEKFLYRSKVELAFGKDEHSVILGMRKRVSSLEDYKWDVVSLNECVVFSEKIEKIITIFEDFAGNNGLTAYEPTKRKGLMRHLILREAKLTGEIMAIIETTNGKLPEMNSLWETLIREVPDIKSFYRTTNNHSRDIINYRNTYHLFGKPYIEDVLGGLTYRIYPESFFQPNPAAAYLLYTTLAELSLLDKNKTILGLYCGIAPIEIFLSTYAEKVIGIDASPINILNAKENCRINGVGNCDFYEGRIEDALKRIRLKYVDIVIVDPPREGISSEGLQLIYKTKPDEVAYVSCNPSTLARDLKDFLKNGFKISKIIPFDFFPHTSHIETLAMLERR